MMISGDLTDIAAAFTTAFQGADAWKHPLVKYYFSAVLIAWPVARICARIGFSRLGTFFLAVPFIGFFLLTLWLALRPWPVTAEKEKA